MKKDLDTKSLLLGYLKKALTQSNFTEVHFGYAEPFPPVSASSSYLSRINIPIEGEINTVAAYDGVIRPQKMQAGHILFTGRGGWAYSLPESVYSAMSIVFMESYIRLVYGEVSYGEKLYNPWYHSSNGLKKISKRILQCINEIMFQTNSDRQSRAIPLIIALLYQVIEEIEHDNSKKMRKKERVYKNIIEYTEQNFHAPINRTVVSTDLKVNPSSFSSIFKEYSGKNFNVYLNELRMKKAERIIKNYDVSIERVADQCGFTSSGYFIKAFKKYFGVTPGSMRSACR